MLNEALVCINKVQMNGTHNPPLEWLRKGTHIIQYVVYCIQYQCLKITIELSALGMILVVTKEVEILQFLLIKRL